jgi:hypothetical protein
MAISPWTAIGVTGINYMQKLMRVEWSKTKVGSWLALHNGLAIMTCKAVESKGESSQTSVLVNLGYSQFGVCDDDTCTYKIKCPECKESCGRSAADTVYLCNTVWKFEGTRPPPPPARDPN